MTEISTSSVQSGRRSISQAVWLSLVGFAASSAAQAKSADASDANLLASASLQEGNAAAELSAVAADLPAGVEPSVDGVVAQGEPLTANDDAHLSAIIEEYLAADASSEALASEEQTAEEVAELMPKAGAFDKLAQGQGYKVAQAGKGGVAAPAIDAASFDPSMLAMLGVGGVVLVAAATSGGSDDGVAPAPAKVGVAGVAVDGYLAGSKAYYDANGNGILDDGEVSALTDASGKFTLEGVTQTAMGRLVIEGGTDVLTGKAFKGQLVSASSDVANVVVSPITSLLASGIDAATLAKSLGLPAGVDLASFDPIAALKSSDPAIAAAGESVLMVAQQVFTVMSTLVAEGKNHGEATSALAKALGGNGGTSLANAVSNGGLVSADTATALNNINASIAQNLGNGALVKAFAGNAGDLTQIMKVVVLAQTTFISDVASGADLAAAYSGAALNAAIDAARIEMTAELLQYLNENGFSLAGAQFTIDQALLDTIGEMYPDLDLEGVELEVVGCQ